MGGPRTDSGVSPYWQVVQTPPGNDVVKSSTRCGSGHLVESIANTRNHGGAAPSTSSSRKCKSRWSTRWLAWRQDLPWFLPLLLLTTEARPGPTRQRPAGVVPLAALAGGVGGGLVVAAVTTTTTTTVKTETSRGRT